MRRIALIGLAGIWITFTGAVRAQVSAFPQPPPLTPPPQHEASQPANNTSGNSSPDSSGAGNGSGGAAPAATSNGAASTTSKPVPVTAATLTSMAALDDKNDLQVGDTISFRVIEDRDDAVTRVVTDTGEVDFPYVGRIKVEGKTCHEVALELKRLLEVDYYKQATVIVGLDLIIGQEKTKHDLAWVIGEVRQEGPQELSKLQPTTVSQAILRAGGFSDYADQRRVRVIHRSALSPEPTTKPPPDIDDTKAGQTIDVKAIFDGHPGPDPIVLPDDYIIVPKRFVNI